MTARHAICRSYIDVLTVCVFETGKGAGTREYDGSSAAIFLCFELERTRAIKMNEMEEESSSLRNDTGSGNAVEFERASEGRDERDTSGACIQDYF